MWYCMEELHFRINNEINVTQMIQIMIEMSIKLGKNVNTITLCGIKITLCGIKITLFGTQLYLLKVQFTKYK